MTIDECINMIKDNVETEWDKSTKEIWIQIAEWLEELKDYRDNTKQICKDLKYWLDNEEKGVVYIPKFIVEKWIKLMK